MQSTVDTIFVSSVNLGNSCIKVYDSETGACIKSYRGICAGSKSLCPVGSSDYLLCAQKDRPLLQGWALNQDDPLAIRFPIPGKSKTMAVSQSKHKYCALGIGEKIYIYHLNSGCQFGIIDRHYQDVTCLQFTSCGNYLISAAEDGFVYVWNMFDMKQNLHKADRPQIEPHYVLGQHSDKVTGLSICGVGMRGILITSSLDHSAKVFDLVTGRLRHTIIADAALTCCVGNAIGSQVFLAGNKGQVWGINLLPQQYKHDLQLEGKGFTCHNSPIHHLALTTAGNVLVTGGADGEVKLWSIVMKEKNQTFGTPSFAIQRTLLMGRGAITNILVRKLDVEVFNVSVLNSRLLLCPFSNSVDILDAKILHQPKTNEMEPFEQGQLLTLASRLMVNEPIKEDMEKRKRKLKNSINEPPSDNMLLECNRRLKDTNEELYKLCLKHILGKG